MKKRATFLLRFYVLTLLIFIVAKLAFMFFCVEGHGLTAGDVWQVIGHGLSLDLSTALYFLIVPFLLSLAGIWERVPRWLFGVYDAVIAVAFALAFVTDTSLYPFWGFKLDVSCLGYLDTPTEAMASVSTGYLMVRVVAVVAVAAAVFGIYWRNGAYRAHEAHGTNRTHRLVETAAYVLCIPFIIIGIRGGLGESTTNIGQVYFSQNQFLNHAAVNPVFSFLASFEKTANYVPDYELMDNEECAEVMKGLYPTKSINPDSLLNTSRPNVVIILMESCGGMFTELWNGRPEHVSDQEVMPRLNRLMHEGVSFDSCYANSWRTDRGTVCTLSGYPSFPTTSVMKMPSKTRLLPSLVRSMKAEGYEASYIYGGDINFTNMRSYLVTMGFERLTWMKDYTEEEQHTSEWGVRDDITFKTLYDQIVQNTAEGRRFVIGFSTLSSHEPWDVPIQKFDDEMLNAFYYLDTCIGELVDSLRQTPAWKDLLLVLLPDHSIDFQSINRQCRYRNQIPMVWTGGAVKSPCRIATICNQTDLAATLLGQMGIAHDDFRYSRDVLSCNYDRPFAIHTFNNGISMTDSTGFAIYDLDARRVTVDESTDAARLMQIGKAILQTSANELKELK